MPKHRSPRRESTAPAALKESQKLVGQLRRMIAEDAKRVDALARALRNPNRHAKLVAAAKRALEVGGPTLQELRREAARLAEKAAREVRGATPPRGGRRAR